MIISINSYEFQFEIKESIINVVQTKLYKNLRCKYGSYCITNLQYGRINAKNLYKRFKQTNRF
jgi:hypothetical protein